MNRPIVLWPKPVHELYSCKLKYCTIVSWTEVTFVRHRGRDLFQTVDDIS